MLTSRDRLATSVGLLAYTVAAAACGRPEDTNASAAWDPPVWPVVEELRIGSLDDSDQALTRTFPPLVAIASDGTLFIGQPQSGEIRAYSEGGGLIRVIGGRGKGPGEFARLASIGVVGDELYAVDLSPPKIEFFTLSGAHLRTRTYYQAFGAHGRPTAPYVLYSDGSGVVSPTRPADIETTILYIRIDSLEAVLDTVLAFPSKLISLPITDGRRSTSIRQPFGRVPPFALSTDGRVVWRAEMDPENRGAYRITKRTHSGDTLHSREYSDAVVEIPSNVRDSAFEVVIAGINRLLSDRSRAERLAKELVSVPTHYSPVLSMRTDTDGSVWLWKPPSDPGYQLWEKHDSDGSPIGQVRLPAALQVVGFRHGSAWGIEHDEFDVPYVVRYRIQVSD